MIGVCPASKEDLRWLAARAPCVLSPHARGIAAKKSSGETVAVVAYDDWTPSACTAHMVSTTPAAWRRLLPHVFEYPFRDSARSLLLGTIRGDNTLSLQMAKRLGFRDTYRIREGWAKGVDLVIVEMKRDECRYLAQERRVA